MDVNNEDEERLWLTEFTNDRTKLAAALARVPAMCVPHDGQPSEKKSTDVAKADTAGGKPDDIVETEKIVGRNGGTGIRGTRRDGSVNVKRTNKKGGVTIDLGDVYDMAAAVKDA